MRSVKRLLIAGALLASVASGCGSGGSGGASAKLSPAVNLPAIPGDNVLSLTVDGANCSPGSYPNKPCVSVTLCPEGVAPSSLPDGSCQTISDILLDTGSYGLRVFKSVLSPALLGNLSPVTQGGKTVGECANFMDGSEDWGPVERASVVLGGEPAISVPIQVVDAGFASPPSYCSSPDATPADAGFNGILGVGPFAQDCGAACVTDNSSGYYYACDSSGCGNGTTLALSMQVTNPVALLPTDNNGVLIDLPGVPAGGAYQANGYVVLGIGTQADNQPSGVRTYLADPDFGEFTTLFDGTRYGGSFLDTGSDALYFNLPSSQASQIPVCSGGNSSQSGWYCPGSTQTFSATNESYTGAGAYPATFQVGDTNALAATPNNAFSELAGFLTDGSGTFDWGLPFHLGRPVFVGIDGKTSSLGTGPYFAF